MNGKDLKSPRCPSFAIVYIQASLKLLKSLVGLPYCIISLTRITSIGNVNMQAAIKGLIQVINA